MAITLADFNKIWASTSPLTPYSFSESNYKQGWNFIGSTPPARQMWDYLQKYNDEKMQYLATNYLPLSGGIMTGSIQTQYSIIKGKSDDTYIEFDGGTGAGCGASLLLFGKDESREGQFWLRTNKTGTIHSLVGKGDGTLAWDGNNIITSAGGTFNGNIFFSGPYDIKTTVDNGYLRLQGNGASAILYGKNTTGYKGWFRLYADDSTSSKMLDGRPDGTLTWNGQAIQTSSDKRLKQDFSAVPADVLEAWGKVAWQQFKYKEDAERKGAENCRFHTGLVAQDVKEVGEENNVDLLKYGILCHDVHEAVEEEKDEDGNVVREASEAVDLWTVRYEEALAMEVIYLRNEIKKLREEISKLK